MTKLVLILYSILTLGIIISIFLLFFQYDKNEIVFEPIYALEQNDTQGYLEYKDKQSRIEFHYPENWYVNQLRPHMIVITPFFDYYLPSFKDYYFDYVDFNKLKSELQKRTETLGNLSLGIEPLLGFDRNSSTFNNSVLYGISIPGEYEQIQPLTIDNHTAYKINRPQAIHIALEIEDTPSNQVFHILIFVEDTKNIHQLIKNGIEKIISSIKISKPFVIENVLTVGKKLIDHNELQNVSIYTMDKYYNKTLPYTNVSIKITYPSGFVLDIPNTISTDENGRFYYEWIIPEDATSGKYTITTTINKENYTKPTTTSKFFYVTYKEKIPLRIEVENIDISDINGYDKQFNIEFKLINPITERIPINHINYTVYWKTVGFLGTIELFSSEYDKKLQVFNNEEEIIRISNLFKNNEIPKTMRPIWDSMSLSSSQGESDDFIINGTFSYNPYHDLNEIENKEVFNFKYTTKKVQ